MFHIIICRDLAKLQKIILFFKMKMHNIFFLKNALEKKFDLTT